MESFRLYNLRQGQMGKSGGVFHVSHFFSENMRKEQKKIDIVSVFMKESAHIFLKF